MTRKARGGALAAVIVLACVWLTGTGTGTGQTGGGPVVLMAIDAEDGAVGEHGDPAIYANLLENMLGNVANGGSNILVIGGGKMNLILTDQVTAFWNAVDAALTTATITYVNGPANIASASFAGYAMLAVVSSFNQSPDGGLTDDEEAALTARADEIGDFVNAGGGVFGLTQVGFPQPYLYLGGVGAIGVQAVTDFEEIDPTPAGLEIGVTDALDVCCWHEDFTSWPEFLQILATDAETGEAAALGGSRVCVGCDVITTTTTSTTPSRPTTTTGTGAPPSPRASAIPARANFVG